MQFQPGSALFALEHFNFKSTPIAWNGLSSGSPLRLPEPSSTGTAACGYQNECVKLTRKCPKSNGVTFRPARFMARKPRS
jgi:hypothetical protein